jgi:thioesterase domain-containing protein
MDGKEPLLTTIEAMAEKYLGEIRDLQPDGPYCLGGYCLGGTIAYEIAQLLRRDGYEVALVALLDTYNFTLVEHRGRFAYLRQRVMFHLSNLVHLRLSNWPDYLSNKLRVAKDGELFSFWRALGRQSGKNSAASSLPPIKASLQEVNDAAAAAYHPQPYPGRVTVFRPKINYDFYPDPQLGWGDLVRGGLEIVELPVNPHAMLIEPYVQVLAERLKEAMRDQLIRSQSTAAN